MEEKRIRTWDEVLSTGHIAELATKIGLPERFFADLGKEDDWSFIIKLHALIEAAVTQLLSFHFSEPKLEDTFANLEMSNVKTGKIAFLKNTGLLGDEYRKFIIELSQLRNRYVHNVSYCARSLKDILSEYDKKQLESFALRFSPHDATMLRMAMKPAEIKLEIDKPDIPKLVKRATDDPKFHIWFGAYDLLTTISEMYGYSDYMQWAKSMKYLHEDDGDDEDNDSQEKNNSDINDNSQTTKRD